MKVLVTGANGFIGKNLVLRLREQAAAQPARRIDAGQPVWVFGAGHFGRALARAMQAQGLAVAGFVETTPQAPKCKACQCWTGPRSRARHRTRSWRWASSTTEPRTTSSSPSPNGRGLPHRS